MIEEVYTMLGSFNVIHFFKEATMVFGIYTIVLVIYLFWLMWGIRKKDRTFQSLTVQKKWKLLKSFLILIAVTWITFSLPLGFIQLENDWIIKLRQLQVSFSILALLTLLISILAMLFPHRNTYLGKLTKIILSGLFASLFHVIIISKFSSSLEADNKLSLIIFFFVILLSFYVLLRRSFEYQLIQISKNLAFDLRCKIAGKIFSTSYENFEKIDKGKVYSVLSTDTTAISSGAGTFATIIVSSLTIFGAFSYLATINFSFTLILLSVLLLLSIIYYVVSVRSENYFEMARDQRTVFMRLIDGLVNGGKEINLRNCGKRRYENDLMKSAKSYRDLTIISSVKFLNVEMLGEIMIILLIGVFAFGLPFLMSSIDIYVQANFLIVILYILGPVQFILAAVPKFLEIKVAWRRIKSFLAEIPSVEIQKKVKTPDNPNVSSLILDQVYYSYKSEDERTFAIGPIDLHLQSGELIFIIGANGSGKSTLAKLMSGLYKPDHGRIMVNGEVVSNTGNHYSAVFNPPYLFQRLYNVNDFAKDKIDTYLQLFELEDKLTIKKGEFSTLDLSSGQRKRLALMQCFLEDAPIFLFDEWAADQDPIYKRFFYTELLPEMKKMGKIIIAITHDDNYFDVADRVLTMKEGRLLQQEITISELRN